MKQFTKPEVSTTCGFSTGLYGCGFTSQGRTPKARIFLSGKWAQKKNSPGPGYFFFWMRFRNLARFTVDSKVIQCIDRRGMRR